MLGTVMAQAHFFPETATFAWELTGQLLFLPSAYKVRILAQVKKGGKLDGRLTGYRAVSIHDLI